MLPFQLHAATRIGVNVGLLLAAVVALRLGSTIIVPVVMALLLASVLGPAAAWMHERLKIRWGLACLVVIIGLVMTMLLMTTIMLKAATSLAQQIPNPNDKAGMIDVYQKLRVKVVAVWPSELDPVIFPPDPKELHEIRIYQYVSEAMPSIMKGAAAATGDWLFQWIIIVFTLLFLLLEGRMLTRRVVEIFGPSELVRGRVGKVLREMAVQVRTYLIWRTIINVALAIVIGLVFQIAGLSYPWAWAFLLLIFNYVPYLGPILAGFPPFFDAVLSTNLTVALVLSVFYWTIIILEGYLIVPLVMGKSMDLNATTVMLACLFWELIWGIPGLFLAMPLMAGIKAVLANIPDWSAWANLMSTSDEPAAPVEADIVPPTDHPPTTNGDGKPDTSSLTNIHLGP